MPLDALTVNLITIAVELLAVVVLFLVAGAILRRIVSAVVASPALARFERAAQVVRSNLRLALIFLCAAACLAVAGVNGWLMWRGENLPEYTRARLLEVPAEFWWDLAIGAGKVVGLVILAALVLRPVRKVLTNLGEKAKGFEGIVANDESLDAFFDTAKKLCSRGLWLTVLLMATRLLALPAGVQDAALVLLNIVLIVSFGMLCWRGLDAVIESLDALSRKYSSPDNLLRFYDRFAHLIPLFRRCVEYVIYLMVGTLVLRQIAPLADIADWGPVLIRIVGVFFATLVVVEIMRLLVEEVLIRRPKLSPDAAQRRRTIVPLVQSVLSGAVWFVAVIVVLGLLDIAVMPILAGAGIVGLALSLGAQNLINDLFSGFFILMDNSYLVGDFIRLNDAEGVVESIDLRTTRIRDNSGRLHVIRNGQIGDVVNFSKEYTRAVVHVGVAYESNLDDVFAALREAGERLGSESPMVLEPLEVKGLDAFGESELTMRVVVKVRPGEHLDTERLLRRRIKEAFDARGVEIPYARRVIIPQPLDRDGDGESDDLFGAAPAA